MNLIVLAAVLMGALEACGGDDSQIEQPGADASMDASKPVSDGGGREDVGAADSAIDAGQRDVASADVATSDVVDARSVDGGDARDSANKSDGFESGRPESGPDADGGAPDTGSEASTDGAADGDSGVVPDGPSGDTGAGIDASTDSGSDTGPDVGSDAGADTSDSGEGGCTPPVVGVCGRAGDGIHCALSNGATAFSLQSAWNSDFGNENGGVPGIEYWRTIQFPDINGDGRSDVCARTKTGIYCGVSNGSWGFSAATRYNDTFSDANGWNSGPQYWATIQFPDINGDGKADLCARGGAGILCGISAGTTGFSIPTVWNSEPSDAHGWDVQARDWGTIQFPDVNGDGKADYCGRDLSGVHCALSNGSTGFTPDTLWSDYFNDVIVGTDRIYWATIQFPDLNGDKKADVCVRAPDGVFCGLSNGVSGFSAPAQWNSDFRDSYGWGTTPAYWGTIQFPDINGDGKADLCGRGAAGVYCGISDGASQFSTASLWNPDFSNGAGWTADFYWGSIQYPDLNGDGKADVCGRGFAGVYCALSNGVSAFTPTTPWDNYFGNINGWSTDPSYWETIRFPMINGGTCGVPRSWSPMPWLSGGLPPR